MGQSAAACLLAIALVSAAGSAPAAQAEAVIAINVLLEPDEALAGVAREANAWLRREHPAGFALDASHAAHLTVLQLYVRAADLEAVMRAVGAVAGRSMPAGAGLSATGLDAAPFAGLEMVSVRVAPDPWLRRLQEELVAALAPFTVAGDASAFVRRAGEAPVSEATVRYVAQFVPGATGASYRPHVTVGVAPPGVAARLLAQPFTPQRFGARAIAIYQLGDFGTARRRLWSLPDAQRGDGEEDLPQEEHQRPDQ